ncbi:MAG: hypothetical protein UY70_C0001G0023 [Candidatus Kaiserbacteria bacterium GW2011_GWB1_52_6]|uniref:Extracellular solute-binding protein family 1 n=3 Tax=Candidatus Kaiseribacteriota TaxID=1752734 RepID=A0A0G1XJR0_9BACT|nr:MAG: hypothetical protein UY67_C0007G0023 [Candidatus Kaiserbacteria bacterium GW2011_GWA2_52_12]KKW28187.1 MAG: hypothetical protein UY70_C0001G0023 [Candidatus Kaiserbacteria bacterium GW2011_GWB1_52_6]KKW31156.1 MAG: hypothetical protein UY74_C0022G0012 [Candidatus Kaiserbacteria bacterium GW2011_GWC2_52_8b]
MILLVIFGALAISGILIFALFVGQGTSNTVGSITVWGTLDQGAFSTVIRQASENTGELSGVVYEQKDAATYDAELTNALANGQGPDIFLMREDQAMKNVGKVYVIPYAILSESEFEATFAVAATPFLTAGGIEAIPLNVDPLVLYWNRDLLASAGRTLPPQYWDEVIPMATYVVDGSKELNASAVTLRDQAGTIKKSAIAFGEYQNISDAKDILAALILQAGGLITTKDSAGHIVSSLSQKATKGAQATVNALRFYTGFADPSRDIYSWNRSLPDARAAFAAGDVGLYVGHASEESLIRQMNPNLNFFVAALPQIRGSDYSEGTAHVYGFAISRTSRNPTGAQTAAYLLASPELSKNLSIALGIPSAQISVLQAALQNTKTKAYENLQIKASHDQAIALSAITARAWVDPDPQETDTIFRAMIENTVSGALRIEDAIQRADQELGHVLGL